MKTQLVAKTAEALGLLFLRATRKDKTILVGKTTNGNTLWIYEGESLQEAYAVILKQRTD